MALENRNDEREARITAYAFGELEGAELAAMEAEVAADPALAARVAELRGFGDDLGAALADEPEPALPAEAPEVFIAEVSPQSRRMADDAEPRGRVTRFPAWAWAATGLAAAAGVAVLVWLRSEGGGVTAPDGPGRAHEFAVVETPSPPAPMPEREPEPALLPAPLEAEAPRVANHEKVTAPEAVATVVPEQPAPEPLIVTPAPESPPPLMVAAVEPVIEIPANTLPPPVSPAAAVELDPNTRVRAMLDKGRGEYVAGDLTAAAASFDAVMKANSRNREARYFSARIAQERMRAGMGGPQAVSVARPATATNRAAGKTTRRSTSGRPGGFPDDRPALVESGFVTTQSEPVSTFSVDVDTASYSLVRRALRPSRMWPSRLQRDEVRIEELINYFPYGYAPPVAREDGSTDVFAAHLAVASAPWAEDHRLVRIGLKGMELAPEDRPAANLVFVVDISGSMMVPRGLALAKLSLLQLVAQLRPDDHVALVRFESKARVVLPSTSVKERDKIVKAIGDLRPSGGSNGAAGIALGYEVAQEHFRPEGVNRVILCTDGMFAARTRDNQPLFALAREQARGRVFLTVLGFGMPTSGGDANLETLADKGDGVYHHVDSPNEARKVLVDDIDGALATIAKDAKVQVEFNPARVSSYRLIGYENRALESDDFEKDRMDAGDVGSGQAVTALYEIVPTGKRVKKTAAGASSAVAESDRLVTVKVRYKDPFDAEGETREQEFALADADVDFEDADEDFRFAASVAAWGMLLRESTYKGTANYDLVRRWAKDCLSNDPGGYREEFLELVKNSRPTASTFTPANRY